MSICVPKILHFGTPSSLSCPNLKCHSDLPTAHIKNSVVCGRRKKKLPILGSAKSKKQLFASAYYIASKLKILPEPLDFMIREYAVGNGGGGGSGWWNWGGGFDGWGRRRKKMIDWKFWGCFAILVVILRLVWLNFGGKLEIGEVWGVLGLSLLGCSVNGWWVNGLKDWAFGFCCCVVVFGWVLKRRDIEKWVKDFRTLKIVGRKRKRNEYFQVMLTKICRKLSLVVSSG